jgi:DNA-binding SARP family transcriptional activator
MGFRLFGPLQAHGPGGPVLLTSRTQRAVLAMLLLEPGRLVRPDRLTGHGLPATPLDDTVAELQQALAAAGAPGILVPEADGYRLDVDPRDVDAERFAAQARAGRRALADGEPATAADHLEAALAEWVGEPLAEFAGEPFAGRVIADLENVHAEVVQDRAEARLALGDVDWCVAELAELVSEMPYRERLWELYATALCRAGRTADALAALQRVRNLLDEELGLAPGPGLLALEKEIRQNAP